MTAIIETIGTDALGVEQLIAQAERIAAGVEPPPPPAPGPKPNNLLAMPLSRRAPQEPRAIKRLLESRGVAAKWRTYFDAEVLDLLLAIQRELDALRERTKDKRSDLDAERFFNASVRPRLALPGGEDLPSLGDLKAQFRANDAAHIELERRLQAPVPKLAGPGCLAILAEAGPLVEEVRQAEEEQAAHFFDNVRTHTLSEELELSIRWTQDRIENSMRRPLGEDPATILGSVIDAAEFKSLL